MRVLEHVAAYGHRRVLATHRSTFEITKERELSFRGNCIIAVRADKSVRDLSQEFKRLAGRDGASIKIEIEVDGLRETVLGEGNGRLTFSHPTDIVVRKGDYACGRTLMIRSNKSALDLSRELVERLRDPKQKVEVELSVEV